MGLFSRKRRPVRKIEPDEVRETIMTPDGRMADVTTTTTAEIDEDGSYRFDVHRRVVAQAPGARFQFKSLPPGVIPPAPPLAPAPPVPPRRQQPR